MAAVATALKLRPLYDRIVVRRKEAKETMRGGIIIHSGTEIKIDDVEYTILREDEVLAIVE